MIARECRHCGNVTETPWKTVCDRPICQETATEAEQAEIDRMASDFRARLAARLAPLHAELRATREGGELR